MVCVGCNPEKTKEVMLELADIAIGARKFSHLQPYLCPKHEKELWHKMMTRSCR